MDFTIVTAAVFQFLPSPRKFQVRKLAAAIFRRRIRNIFSRNAATTASWFPIPEQMPRVLEIAMQTAIARHGVSVVAMPGDIALCEAVVEHPRLKFPPPQPSVCPSDDEITQLAKVLNDSEKITILAGAGCAGAHTELIAIA